MIVPRWLFVFGLIFVVSVQQGLLPGGEFCTYNSECLSGSCVSRICNVGSEQSGKIGSYGRCQSDYDCYSGLCNTNQQVCEPSVPGHQGKVATGGSCTLSYQCVSNACANNRCTDVQVEMAGFFRNDATAKHVRNNMQIFALIWLVLYKFREMLL